VALPSGIETLSNTNTVDGLGDEAFVAGGASIFVRVGDG